MKNLKLIFSSLLLLVTVCQFSSVAACDTTTALPVYQRVIEQISLSYDEAMLVGTIQLDHEIILKIVDYRTRDDNVMKTWAAGQVVTLTPHIKNDALIFSVKRAHGPDYDKVEAYAIFDVTEAPRTSLRVVEINEGGKFVKLNDGSVWEFSWYNRFSTNKWHLGQRVLVAGQGEKNSYNFINLDAPLTLDVYSATASFVAH